MPGCGIQLRQKHPRRQGDLGEAAAIHWLTEIGANVCVPLFHSSDFDLVAELNGQLLRVQVKTCTRERDGRFAVQLATFGGNQSWNGVVKTFSASRCDFLFVLVEGGRTWFIPSAEVEGTRAIVVGGRKYEEFEISTGTEGGPFYNRSQQPGGAGVGEPGRTVNPVP